MYMHLPTSCLNVALLMSGRQSKSWTYFYFIVWTIWIQHKLIDFHGPIILLHLFLVSWFKKNNNNLTLRRLQICNEATKPIFNYSNLVYIFFIIYNICTILSKNILHKISQNYQCITWKLTNIYNKW